MQAEVEEGGEGESGVEEGAEVNTLRPSRACEQRLVVFCSERQSFSLPHKLTVLLHQQQMTHSREVEASAGSGHRFSSRCHGDTQRALPDVFKVGKVEKNSHFQTSA